MAFPVARGLFLFGILVLPNLASADEPPPCHFAIVVRTTRFCASVRVSHGYLTLLPATGKLKIANGFSTSKPDENAIKQKLASYAQRILNRRKLYTFGLPQISTSSPPPDFVVNLEAGTVTEAISKLKQWKDCRDCDNVVNRAVAALPFLSAAPHTDSTHMFGLLPETPLSDAKLNRDDSFLDFAVDSLVGDLSAMPVTFDLGTAEGSPKGRLLTGDDVRTWISDHYKGKFWIQREIIDHFQTLYQDIAMSPHVFVSPGGSPRAIHITESSRIGRIIIPGTSAAPDPNTDKIFYVLLDTSDFHKSPHASLYDIPALSVRALCLPELQGLKCDENHLPAGADQQQKLAYLDTLTLADRQAELQQLGYSVVTVAEGPSDNLSLSPVDLQVQKASKDTNAAKGSSAEEPARPKAVPKEIKKEGVIQPATGKEAVAESGESVTPAEPDHIPAPPASTSFAVGAQLLYRPGQAVRVQGIFQVAPFKLPGFLGGGASSFSVQAGADRTQPIGSGNFQSDYLWFNQLKLRLSLQVNYATDATSQRILAGLVTDERRTGPMAHVEAELFHNLGGWSLTVSAEPHHDNITLTPVHASSVNDTLTTIEAQSALAFKSSAVLHPLRLEINPAIKWGVSGSASVAAYTRFSTDAGLHWRLYNPWLVSLEMAGQVQVATSHTPLFELPSLGGPQSVRGFRADDALGRSAGSLQTELWSPLPFTLKTEDAGAVRSFLRKNIRMAGFYDFGVVSGTNFGILPIGSSTAQQFQAGLRQGPGLGVRFIQGPIALKLDWAYGFGQGAMGPGHGRFYLGVSSNGAF